MAVAEVKPGTGDGRLTTDNYWELGTGNWVSLSGRRRFLAFAPSALRSE